MSIWNNPMGKALHDAAETRQETRERIVAALRGPQGLYGAQQAHRDGQEAIARHRQRAQQGARVASSGPAARPPSGATATTTTEHAPHDCAPAHPSRVGGGAFVVLADSSGSGAIVR